MKKLAINNQEIGIYIKNNEVDKIYSKGNYWIFFNKNIEKLNINEIIDEKYHTMFLENEKDIDFTACRPAAGRDRRLWRNQRSRHLDHVARLWEPDGIAV